MSLRKQLAIFSLLTLLLPWAGYRYVREMESVLRSGLNQSLTERALTVAGALERQGHTAALHEASAPTSPSTTIFARQLAAAPRTDGSRDDWNLPDEQGVALGDAARYWAGVFGSFLYVSIEVTDNSVVYQQRPGQPPYGDRVVVQLRGANDATQWWVLNTAAPGAMRPQQTQPPRFDATGVFDDRAQAAWQQTGTGFSVELRVPLTVARESFGLGVIDVDAGSGLSDVAYAVSIVQTWDEATGQPGRLVVQLASLTAGLAQFSDNRNRYRILDRDAWLIASAGATNEPGAASGSRSLTEDIVRYVLQTDDPPYRQLESALGKVVDPVVLRVFDEQSVVQWYRGDFEADAVVVAAVPLKFDGNVVGGLLLEQASDSILTATNQALLRLVGFTFGISLFALFGMLAFATFLSYRVGRLANAAESALGPKGQIQISLPGQTARDEIGGLSRSFGRLLERLREYTSYLRTLTSKLSHELRTPLAVVSTSLDNLEKDPSGPDSHQYLSRLRQGVDRLDAILVAMSEATRMEQAINETATVKYELQHVVQSCVAAYRDVYPQRVFEFVPIAGEAYVNGAEDLIAQLLDKLVDNAVSFSEAGSCIIVQLEQHDDEYCLSVTNEGDLLPEEMQKQLFDSLVSVRPANRDKPHLGLGLYIAELIAKFHRGRMKAENLADRSGVRISVVIPRAR